MAGLIAVDRNALLPLNTCSIKAEVHGYLVGLNATIKYANDGEAPVEIVFTFPLENSYCFLGMEASVGGRKINTALQERQDSGSALCSEATSEEAKADFRVSLGCLAVGNEAIIHLRLVGELPAGRCGEAKFTLPAMFHLDHGAMQLGEANDMLTEMQSGRENLAEFDFQMAVKPRNVSDVTSPTHILSVDRNEEVIMVTLSPPDYHMKDNLVILIHKEEPIKVSQELGVTSRNGDRVKGQSVYMGSPIVMVSYFPNFHVEDPVCELIFLVDRSKNMRGPHIHCASEALISLLKSIPTGCSFNIIGFGSSLASLFKESVAYNEENLQQAMSYVESMKADLGAADLPNALRHVFNWRQFMLSRQVFILTAGSVDDNQACIDEVVKNMRHCRIFTFGIGCGTSKTSVELVNGLAKAGRGVAEIINEGERVQPKVVGSLKKALQPSVTMLKATFEVPPEYEVLQAPSELHNVYDGDKLIFYGVLRNKAEPDTPIQSSIHGVMKLEGQVPGLKNQEHDMGLGFTIVFVIPPSEPETQEKTETNTFFDIPVVHHLAAKSILKDWDAGEGWGSTASPEEKVKESTRISIESSVIYEHTTFVAIDEELKKPIDGAITCISPARIQQDVHVDTKPKHHHGAGIFGNIKKLYISATSHKSKGAVEADTTYRPLSDLVMHQHASGFWLLKDVSELVMEKPEAAKEECPAEVSEEVWATLLALAFLDHKYLKEKSEWELIAVKAEKWLKGQNLPSDLESLRKTVKTLVI